MDNTVLQTVAALAVAVALAFPAMVAFLLSCNFLIGCAAKCADLYARWRTRKHVV